MRYGVSLMDKGKMADSRYQKLLEAAVKLFGEKGFHRASMSDIAREVGLGKTTLYHHIESKEELLYVILFRACEYYQRVLREALSAPDDPCQSLEKAIEVHIDLLVSEFELASLVLNEFHHISGKYRRTIHSEINKLTGIWVELLERGISCGAFRSGLDVKMTLLCLFGICNGIAQAYKPERWNSTKELSQIITKGIMEGIRA